MEKNIKRNKKYELDNNDNLKELLFNYAKKNNSNVIIELNYSNYDDIVGKIKDYDSETLTIECYDENNNFDGIQIVLNEEITVMSIKE